MGAFSIRGYAGFGIEQLVALVGSLAGLVHPCTVGRNYPTEKTMNRTIAVVVVSTLSLALIPLVATSQAGALGSPAFCATPERITMPPRVGLHPTLSQMIYRADIIKVLESRAYKAYENATTPAASQELYDVSTTAYSEYADLKVAIGLKEKLAAHPTSTRDRTLLTKALSNVEVHAVAVAHEIAVATALWNAACASTTTTVTTTTAPTTENEASALAIADDVYYTIQASDPGNPTTAAAYSAAASQESSSNVTSVVPVGSTLAKFEFTSGPSVCVTTGTSQPVVAAC